jgi:hypothetical protein
MSHLNSILQSCISNLLASFKFSLENGCDGVTKKLVTDNFLDPGQDNIYTLREINETFWGGGRRRMATQEDADR